ncbi:MAG: peptidoglycan editing factor PgeF [Epsilonproteobacteria bacterium]|nr:peptidoglycan editing factor PgeF [Campylobacterota bacterium]
MKFLFTNRDSGVSKAEFKSFNLAQHVGDDPKNVTKNRELLCGHIGAKNLVFMDQIHGDHIEIISKLDTKKVLKTDGMITNLKDIVLCVMVADCLPILFYDDVKKVIAAAHAGRNGVRLKIANKIIQEMAKEFFCKVENIKVYIGAGIKTCCYEIKRDTSLGFEDYLIFKDKKMYLDITKKCVDDLKDIGVSEENMEVSTICTSCDESYFSYRRDGKTGRFCGVITL